MLILGILVCSWSQGRGGNFISGQLSSCKDCSQSYARLIPSMEISLFYCPCWESWCSSYLGFLPVEWWKSQSVWEESFCAWENQVIEMTPENLTLSAVVIHPSSKTALIQQGECCNKNLVSNSKMITSWSSQNKDDI